MQARFHRVAERRSACATNKKDDTILMILKTGRQSTDSTDLASDATPASKALGPGSFDDLLRAVRELLMDPRLDLSVVTPLIYSLLETFIDDFQQYPYDQVSKLLARLEQEAYPAHGLRELISRIEEAYGQNHNEAIHDTPHELATNDDFEGLRQSVRYAAMVAERDDQRGCSDDTDAGWLPNQQLARRDR